RGVASEIGYAGPLRLLAFDHRDLVKKMARERARERKRLIYEGFLRGASGEGAGLLVDEELGAEIAGEALAADYVVAMPVERSGSDAFEFEYARSIRQLRNAGLDPDVWKVEGSTRRTTAAVSSRRSMPAVGITCRLWCSGLGRTQRRSNDGCASLHACRAM